MFVLLFSNLKELYIRKFIWCSQKNGRIEWKHRHLLDTDRALRLHAQLPIESWGDCLLSAIYMINRMPSSVLYLQITYRVLVDKPTLYDHYEVISCLCFAAVKLSDKFVVKAKKCVLLSYPFAHKGYKLLI